MRHLFAIVVLLCVAVPAYATATDLQKFEKRVRKLAVENLVPLKPKSLCVCQEQSISGTVGIVQYTTAQLLGVKLVAAVCQVPVYTLSGKLQEWGDCHTWIPLAK